jgi:hypothetical protein
MVFKGVDGQILEVLVISMLETGVLLTNVLSNGDRELNASNIENCKVESYFKEYYTSNSNCPIRKHSLCHVSMKLIAISRLITSSISEPAFLLTMFHSMFPGEHGVEHYSRGPRETTRMTTTWPTKYK